MKIKVKENTVKAFTLKLSKKEAGELFRELYDLPFGDKADCPQVYALFDVLRAAAHTYDL